MMERLCSKCGQGVGAGDKYCISCGALLEDEKDNVENTKPLSLADYMLIGLILMIPVVNIIVFLIWLFDRKANVNRRNIAKATLIYIAFFTVFTGIMAVGLLRAAHLDRDVYPEYYEYYPEYNIDHDGEDWHQIIQELPIDADEI